MGVPVIQVDLRQRWLNIQSPLAVNGRREFGFSLISWVAKAIVRACMLNFIFLRCKLDRGRWVLLAQTPVKLVLLLPGVCCRSRVPDHLLYLVGST